MPVILRIFDISVRGLLEVPFLLGELNALELSMTEDIGDFSAERRLVERRVLQKPLTSGDQLREVFFPVQDIEDEIGGAERGRMARIFCTSVQKLLYAGTSSKCM